MHSKPKVSVCRLVVKKNSAYEMLRKVFQSLWHGSNTKKKSFQASGSRCNQAKHIRSQEKNRLPTTQPELPDCRNNFITVCNNMVIGPHTAGDLCDNPPDRLKNHPDSSGYPLAFSGSRLMPISWRQVALSLDHDASVISAGRPPLL